MDKLVQDAFTAPSDACMQVDGHACVLAASIDVAAGMAGKQAHTSPGAHLVRHAGSQLTAGLWLQGLQRA